MKNKVRKDLLELISMLPEEDCRKIFRFLYGVYFSQDENVIYFYGKDKEIWIAKAI